MNFARSGLLAGEGVREKHVWNPPSKARSAATLTYAHRQRLALCEARVVWNSGPGAEFHNPTASHEHPLSGR